MNSTNFVMLPMSHRRGTATYSASTLSVGMVVCEKSYSRLLVSTWIAVMGRNGRTMLGRRYLGEHRRGLGQACQLVRRQLRHLAAEYDAVHGQTDFVTDLTRHDVV